MSEIVFEGSCRDRFLMCGEGDETRYFFVNSILWFDVYSGFETGLIIELFIVSGEEEYSFPVRFGCLM